MILSCTKSSIEDENFEALENEYQMFHQTEPENLNNFLKCEISENLPNDNNHVKTFHKNEQKETTKIFKIHQNELTKNNETCDLCGKVLKSNAALVKHRVGLRVYSE